MKMDKSLKDIFNEEYLIAQSKTYQTTSTSDKINFHDFPEAIDRTINGLYTVNDKVNHPNHYGGKDNLYEAIKVIEAWNLSFCLGNAVKYISRAGKKDVDKFEEDIEKAIWYLQHELETYKVKKFMESKGE